MNFSIGFLFYDFYEKRYAINYMYLGARDSQHWNIQQQERKTSLPRGSNELNVFATPTEITLLQTDYIVKWIVNFYFHFVQYSWEN